MYDSEKPILISDTRRSDAWVRGVYGAIKFTAKVFDIPSVFGINEGRVSKLFISGDVTGKMFCAYDRGWDIEPAEGIQMFVYEDVLRFLEGLKPCGVEA